MADMIGVPRRVIEHFSRRRAEVLEHMASRGETSARAAQVATLDTRRRKDYGVPVERLRDQWRARAAEHGLVPQDLTRIQGSGRRRPLDDATWDRVVARLAGPDGLTRHASTFIRRDVLQAFAEAAATGTTVGELERRATWVPRSSGKRGRR